MSRIRHRDDSQTSIGSPPRFEAAATLDTDSPPTLPAGLRRLFAVVSTALLLAFGLWSVLLLLRSHHLRHELEHHLAQLDEIRQIHDLLEPWREGPLSDSTQADARPSASVGAPESTREPTERVLLEGAIQRLNRGDLAADENENDGEFLFTVRSLRQALDELAHADDATRRWNASQRALVNATSLEARLQHRVADQLRRLDEHWWAFDRLVVGALLLVVLCWLLLARGQLRRRQLEALQNEAVNQALHDRLTGLWNRPAILALLRDELARAARGQSPLGVILLDIDHFKELNVMLGEDQGDFILEQLAERLDERVRPYDTVGRLGGDSFLVVLPACDAIATGTVANRLRECVNENDVEHGLGRIRITLSMAFTTLHHPADVDADLLIHRLEEQLSKPETADPIPGLGRVVALDEDPAAA